jgi:hypothetical protein
LRKQTDITDPLTFLNIRIIKDLFNDWGFKFKPLDFLISKASLFGKSLYLRKIIILFIGLSFTVKAVAPDTTFLTISEAPVIQPYAPLMNAIGIFETMGNTLAFNEFENAAGIFQIRQVRVDDYNQRTGSNYTLLDMFDYEISQKVFLYFAEIAGPYSFEKIAKAWNGSGPRTEFYWNRIKALLPQ